MHPLLASLATGPMTFPIGGAVPPATRAMLRPFVAACDFARVVHRAGLALAVGLTVPPGSAMPTTDGEPGAAPTLVSGEHA